MKKSLTDVALATAYSPEADRLRALSKKWFVASQLLMLAAGTPVLLAFAGVVVSFFSGSSDSFVVGAGVSVFGGIAVSFLTMLLFCPFAIFCFYKFYATRKKIDELVANSIRNSKEDLEVSVGEQG